jgi:hypothetical protein
MAAAVQVTLVAAIASFGHGGRHGGWTKNHVGVADPGQACPDLLPAISVASSSSEVFPYALVGASNKFVPPDLPSQGLPSGRIHCIALLLWMM